MPLRLLKILHFTRQRVEERLKLPCQAVVFIETCTSGGFASAHKNDPPLPANVTALCACSAKQAVDNQLDMAVAAHPGDVCLSACSAREARSPGFKAFH